MTLFRTNPRIWAVVALSLSMVMLAVSVALVLMAAANGRVQDVSSVSLMVVHEPRPAATGGLAADLRRLNDMLPPIGEPVHRSHRELTRDQIAHAMSQDGEANVLTFGRKDVWPAVTQADNATADRAANPTAAESQTDVEILEDRALTEQEIRDLMITAAASADGPPRFNGKLLKPVRTMKMRVTAYSPDERSCGIWADGITASGYSVWTNGMKLVAADTRLLPFGTLITIPGYHNEKPVPVLDRGGAIKGNRLDVLYPTHEIALQWGVKDLEVTVWAYAD